MQVFDAFGFGNYFSDGIEVITRMLCAIGTTVLYIVGGGGFVLFILITSPITLLGWIAYQLGFVSTWRHS